MGEDLNTTSIMMRECFHLHSLFRMRTRFTQENMFLQQHTPVMAPLPMPMSPEGLSPSGLPPLGLDPPVAASRASAVISGGSPMTQAGKSSRAMPFLACTYAMMFCLNKGDRGMTWVEYKGRLLSLLSKPV